VVTVCYRCWDELPCKTLVFESEAERLSHEREYIQYRKGWEPLEPLDELVGEDD